MPQAQGRQIQLSSWVIDGLPAGLAFREGKSGENFGDDNPFLFGSRRLPAAFGSSGQTSATAIIKEDHYVILFSHLQVLPATKMILLVHPPAFRRLLAKKNVCSMLGFDAVSWDRRVCTRPRLPACTTKPGPVRKSIAPC